MISMVKLSECVLKQGGASHFQLEDRCRDLPAAHFSASHHYIVVDPMTQLDRENNAIIVLPKMAPYKLW